MSEHIPYEPNEWEDGENKFNITDQDGNIILENVKVVYTGAGGSKVAVSKQKMERLETQYDKAKELVEAHKADDVQHINEIANIRIDNDTTYEIDIAINEQYDFFVLEVLSISLETASFLRMTFNHDDGANYSNNTPGGGDEQNSINLIVPARVTVLDPKIAIVYISNLIGYNKTVIGKHELEFTGTSSAGTAQIRGKWNNVIDRITSININATGKNIGKGSKFRLLGVR